MATTKGPSPKLVRLPEGARAPIPGDIGLVATNDWAGKLIRWATKSPVNHAFISLGGDAIVEAEPGGARIGKASEYSSVIWVTAVVGFAELNDVAEAAKLCQGVPYGWLDIAAIAFACRRNHLYNPDKAPAYIRRISDNGTMICSQLCDWAYSKAGIQLFTGRPTGLVTPGDLLPAN